MFCHDVDEMSVLPAGGFEFGASKKVKGSKGLKSVYVRIWLRMKPSPSDHMEMVQSERRAERKRCLLALLNFSFTFGRLHSQVSASKHSTTTNSPPISAQSTCLLHVSIDTSRYSQRRRYHFVYLLAQHLDLKI